MADTAVENRINAHHSNMEKKDSAYKRVSLLICYDVNLWDEIFKKNKVNNQMSG